ncbi:hypothetical protein CC86DRAFT_444102 [Ophiobolus disseminans]|uniref:Orc1-like AAA ATPase domain-containing protein n=1 Tax=Ophiobolus disseminans TaxID=1469910 RepID=A0A6A7A9W0_9PLEO|nr:hypothetical protein CC86DRAFT_444102 [Ophiobolus disseminans]
MTCGVYHDSRIPTGSTTSFGNRNYGIQAGVINGEVKPTIYLPPVRPETPPPPLIVVTFAHDAEFVERGTILKRVHHRCAATGSRVALVGLGGVGKSQLAIEYAYRTYDRSPGTWVFWVHASNAARFEQSYRNIANRVKIAGQQDPQANIFKLALALFKKKLEVEGDNSDIVELAAALEYMPLALVQAAAYIWQSAPRCSVAQYLEEFWRSNSEKTSLLDYEAGQLQRDWEAKNSIIMTWQISFEHLHHHEPSAAGLLSLISFFDRQGIPETLIHGGQGVESASIASDRRERESDGNGVNFENNMGVLHDLSLISISTDGATFEMHSLLERWKQQFISNLCAEFPTGQYENWAACQALFAHAKAAASQEPEAASALIEWATLLYRAAWYAGSKGNAGWEAE